LSAAKPNDVATFKQSETRGRRDWHRRALGFALLSPTYNERWP
jgi:hypothetical protein